MQKKNVHNDGKKDITRRQRRKNVIIKKHGIFPLLAGNYVLFNTHYYFFYVLCCI